MMENSRFFNIELTVDQPSRSIIQTNSKKEAEIELLSFNSKAAKNRDADSTFFQCWLLPFQVFLKKGNFTDILQLFFTNYHTFTYILYCARASAGGGIRTHEGLRHEDLNLTPLTWLGNPCPGIASMALRWINSCYDQTIASTEKLFPTTALVLRRQEGGLIQCAY